MCSIVGSFSKEKFTELMQLNQFRGNFSYSVSLYNIIDKKITFQSKSFGEYSSKVLDILDTTNCYVIGHVQAPTGGLTQDTTRIHPTNAENTFLWHNGIITSRGIKNLQKTLGSQDTFDTLLLNKSISQNFDSLSEIEGLFTCLFVDENKGKVNIFRTKHGKLFVDEDLNISSEKFKNSKCINYDTVYELDFINKKLNIIQKFKTLRYNIIIEGEL